MPKGLVWISTTKNAIRNFATSRSGNVTRFLALLSTAQALLSKSAAISQGLALAMVASNLKPPAMSLG